MPTLTLDTTLLTNVCNWVGKAHCAYIHAVGATRDDDDSQSHPFYWLETVKCYVRGGNDLPTGIASGSTLTVAQQASPNNTVNVTGGNVVINGQTVAVATNATYGSSTIFTQTCTDGSPLTTGQFYDAALCADHVGALAVFRGPRQDRPDTEEGPSVPIGYCLLATIRINYNASATVIATANITAGPTLTAYSAPANDAEARMFNDFDSGQQNLISRKAVKNELGFALTSLNNYVTTVTASQGLNGGAGYNLLQWAKTTHQTGSPWDFPDPFIEFIRVLKNGKDPSKRLATINFTGSGVATVTDLKKVIGFQDKLELVVVSAVSTGGVSSTISVTVQSYAATTALVYTATVPANSPNGTVIAMNQSGTAPTQSPIAGTATNTAIAGSTVLAAAPTGVVTPKIWTALVPSNPIAVSGGTNGDSFALRNVGTL